MLSDKLEGGGWAQSFGFGFDQNVADGSSVVPMYTPFSSSSNENACCRPLTILQYKNGLKAHGLTVDNHDVTTFSLVGVPSEIELIDQTRFRFKLNDGTGEIVVEWVKGIYDSEFAKRQDSVFLESLKESPKYLKCYLQSAQMHSEVKALHCRILTSFHEVIEHLQDVAKAHLRYRSVN